MIDPRDPLNVQVVKQARIIDALMRRANRQKDVGPSAFRAFQSAIELQQKVAAQTRDLERAATELAGERLERERTRRSLIEALSSMEEGFALFLDSKLDLSNELFQTLLPDISRRLVPGLPIASLFTLMSRSAHYVSSDRNLERFASRLSAQQKSTGSVSTVLELRGDRWFQLNAQYTSTQNIVVLLTDITALVRQNRDEKASLIGRQEDYLKAVFQNVNAGICTFSADGELMMHNGRFEAILGLPISALSRYKTSDELLDVLRKHGAIKAEDDGRIAAWRKELNAWGWLHKRVRGTKDQVLDICANRLPDGGFLVELKDVTLEARATEVLEHRVMARTAELTRANAKLIREYEEKARVEEELRLAKERAEAAVSAKTRFLAAASHDLLQPINAAKLLISTLMETTRDTQFSPIVERLQGAFGSAEQLLHSLLDLSRLESADPDMVAPTDVSLGGIIGGVYSDQVLMAEQKNVRLDVVPSTAIVHSDPVYLLRSVQNLVVNAIQYTEPGGRVLIGCRHRNGKVVLEIWDTGIGIAQKDQAKIFEEFARAENVPLGSGIGLGLSVVDRACRLLGHSLSVQSTPGLGSLFRIEMDRAQDPAAQIEPAAFLPASEETMDHIILVIENDRDVLFGTTQLLEQWGASVLPAASTDEAARLVADMGAPPDIILADYQLDGDDTGVNAITRIRSDTGIHVPAILISANRRESLREAGIQNDVSVMTKPVKLSRLRPLIDWKIRWQPAMPEAPGQGFQVAQTKVCGDTALQARDS